MPRLSRNARRAILKKRMKDRARKMADQIVQLDEVMRQLNRDGIHVLPPSMMVKPTGRVERQGEHRMSRRLKRTLKQEDLDQLSALTSRIVPEIADRQRKQILYLLGYGASLRVIIQWLLADTLTYLWYGN